MSLSLKVFPSLDKRLEEGPATTTDIESGASVHVDKATTDYIDKASERSYVRKLDIYLLPYLALMYFFNAVDRSNLGNAETDGLSKDLHFVGNEYSLLILLFYIPFGTLDLPLNILTKRFTAALVLPILMITWGSVSLLQCAAFNFGGLLVCRLVMGACEAGFFAGVVFYLTLFYSRGELGFRIAIVFGSALLAAAFSGLIAFGVFHINTTIPGWKYLMIIEGSLTLVFGVIAFFWLPASPQTAWFLNQDEKSAATARSLRDSSNKVSTKFNLKDCFQIWKDWKFALWCVIAFVYPVAFATTSNFLPQIVQRLGYSTVKTNLWTVAPNAVGFIVLLLVAKSSDYFRERTFHIIGSLITSLLGMIILITIDVLDHKGVAYFACFLMAAGAYIPSCLVQTWHNNNNLDENSRAATTGLLVGLGNFAGILSAATFRVEYAPKYIPTLITTCICNVIAIASVLILGLWMRAENRRRNEAIGTNLRAQDVSTSELSDGENSLKFRYFV
ncbi:hypothetical protein V499_07271 [Pseudogymnoascus sp. VKM F-103]|nr:hypothetical protein V499_07271 [Pseudogymnoascus sp. VKM F-103]